MVPIDHLSNDLWSNACADLAGLEQTFADYIFTNMLSMEEQLINHDVLQATRVVLHTIAPGREAISLRIQSI